MQKREVNQFLYRRIKSGEWMLTRRPANDVFEIRSWMIERRSNGQMIGVIWEDEIRGYLPKPHSYPKGFIHGCLCKHCGENLAYNSEGETFCVNCAG